MNITAADLMTPPSYRLARRAHKQKLIRYRRDRSLTLGPCMRLQFEDDLTIRYQIQEVLHAERISDIRDIQHEIDTYAHLVPDGSNWKATLLIELPDTAERRRDLPLLNEAAHRIYVEVPRHRRVFAPANEDLPDRQLARPSAVHFLRFQLPEALRAALLAGATAALGCAHDQYGSTTSFRRPPRIGCAATWSSARPSRIASQRPSRSIADHSQPEETQMTHSALDDHGPGLTLAHTEIDAVTLCPRGIITVSVQYLSLRFETAAFRELQALLAVAQRRLDGDPALPALHAPSAVDAPMH